MSILNTRLVDFKWFRRWRGGIWYQILAGGFMPFKVWSQKSTVFSWEKLLKT